MDFQFANKVFVITGVANKKSIAYSVAKELIHSNAKVIFTVQNNEIKTKVSELFPQSDVEIVDVSREESIFNFAQILKNKEVHIDGFLHSIAFANYSEGMKPFHETKLQDFIEAQTISCFSLTMFSNALKDILVENASVVAMSISNTRATNYGYMGPIKAALDASIAFLAKSFSIHSKVRFNTVAAGPLKTSASAGIPGYIDNYLYAEQLTLRHEALKTSEVANTALFLLSSLSSGINATSIVVDAGMSANYFDESCVKALSVYHA